LRATRERVHRDREFMLGDFQRFDLVHYTRPGRNMGDYIVSGKFRVRYETVSSLFYHRSGMRTLIHHMRACYHLRQL
jgi:hypothetical protein